MVPTFALSEHFVPHNVQGEPFDQPLVPIAKKFQTIPNYTGFGNGTWNQVLCIADMYVHFFQHEVEFENALPQHFVDGSKKSQTWKSLPSSDITWGEHAIFEEIPYYMALDNETFDQLRCLSDDYEQLFSHDDMEFDNPLYIEEGHFNNRKSQT